ncbi:hypothetical protein [Variovorax sp. AFSI2.2]|uniref:hypothetical protein n=1 Tax=Variovorax sp. AFSI2.2 TaxID=3384160 RepID=UPI003EC12510
MSFIVQIFDRITATDVRSALAACNRDQPVSPRVAAMFEQFLREVQCHFPLAARANGVDQPLIWTEGLPLGPVESSPLNLGVEVDALDDTVLSTLGHVAADAGLQMLEPQGGALYRLDRQVIFDDGSAEPFAERTPRAEPRAVAAASFDTTKTPHSLDVLCGALMEKLGPLGFEAQPHPHWEHVRLVQRTYGPTVQAFCIQVQPEHDRQYVHFMVRWWLPAVREAWLERLDEIGGPELRDRIRPLFMPEHERMLGHFHGRRDPRLADDTLRSEGDLQAYAQALAVWCAEQGMYFQNAPRNMAELGKIMLSVDHLSNVLKAGESGVHGSFYLPQQMGLLVLALTCKTPLREVWLETLRHRQRVTQHVQWKHVTGGDGNALFEGILASLTERPPALGG